MSQAAPNPLRNIIIMVVFAIIVFVAFLAYSVKSSVENNERLSTIKEAYFPVLERVDANIVRLDKMEERFINAVMIGETDLIDQASEHYRTADGAFAEMTTLFPAYAEDIGKLRQEFADYHGMAVKTSLGLLKGVGDMAEQAGKMNDALQHLRASIQSFRKFSYDKFVQTLDDSKRAAKLSLYMGIAVGIMNLFFMGVLVFFIRNNVKMMAVIAEQNENLERRVTERTAQLTQKTNDINAMLQNMKLGVCAVESGNRLHPEYSAYMKEIFNRGDLAGQVLENILFAGAELSADVQDQVKVALAAIVGEDAMMYEFNGHLLVREMALTLDNGQHKILQLDWNPIMAPDDSVEKVLLIIQDVTHLRELELEASHQKEELDIIAQIIKIAIGKFNDFVASSRQFVNENRELITKATDFEANTVAALFRNMHTIKGNARTYELSFITDAAHIAEQTYDELRKSTSAHWDGARLMAELDAVQAALDRYVLINEDKLGRKGRASDLLTTRGSFVSHAELEELRQLSASLSGANDLKQKIARLGHVPLRRLCDGAVDSLSALSKELGKPAPTVMVDNGDIAFSTEFAEALKSSLIHIVRNSMDHGIEAPADRLAAGKPEQGCVQFATRIEDQQLRLSIRDDGRGLALHKLYEKGRAAGVLGDDQRSDLAAIAELIFHSGLSTAEQLTQVSGRGVGMDAVRSFLEAQGAKIHIVLERSSGEPGFVPFQFVIEVPPERFQV